MKNIYIIAKKELRGYFDSPVAYIVLVVFLLLWQFLYFKMVFLIGETSLHNLFDVLPWLFLFFIPAITMGSISQEKSEGTLELLLTHPVREWEILFGKLLAGVGFVSIALLFSLPIGISMDIFGDLDWGIVCGQLLATIGMGFVLVSFGICVSSFFRSQITALLVTIGGTLFLILFHSPFITNGLPLPLGSLLEKLSVSTHFTSMARGVLDLRDIWYFFSVTAVFMGIATMQLLKAKWGNQKSKYRSFTWGILLGIGIIILLNILGNRLPGRIDLTREDIYTLSPGTKKVLQNIDDIVNITLYASQELPVQFQPNLRDTEDILRDYETLGKGNIVLQRKDPSSTPEIRQEASALGIQEIQFNVISQEEFQVKNGYLGLSVSYGGETKSIPFLENTADLEYQLSSFISQLIKTEKKKIVFLSGHGEKSIHAEYKSFSQELSGQYEQEEFTFPDDIVENINIETEEREQTPTEIPKELPSDTDILVIAGGTQELSEEETSALRTFLKSGGPTLLLVDPISIDMQSFTATENAGGPFHLLEEYRITFEKNIVYDLQSHERVQFNEGFISYFLPYPLWIRTLPNNSSPITSRMQEVVFPWASSLHIDPILLQEKNQAITNLLETSDFSGTQEENFQLQPGQSFPQENLKKNTIAISLQGDVRIIAVGDSDFLSNASINGTPENMVFGLNAISWLSQEDSLANIRLKQRNNSPLLFENEDQKSLVKYGNMAFALSFPSLFGVVRLLRRKSLRKFTFSQS
jgi:ABC-type transport system involved in multi-copper enzyme maturation permease subunit/ABC-type uncharacterized transport system involved in gliding motility auxiliary subunit